MVLLDVKSVHSLQLGCTVRLIRVISHYDCEIQTAPDNECNSI